jgi:hypothetical protein
VRKLLAREAETRLAGAGRATPAAQAPSAIRVSPALAWLGLAWLGLRTEPLFAVIRESYRNNQLLKRLASYRFRYRIVNGCRDTECGQIPGANLRSMFDLHQPSGHFRGSAPDRRSVVATLASGRILTPYACRARRKNTATSQTERFGSISTTGSHATRTAAFLSPTREFVNMALTKRSNLSARLQRA